MIPRPADAITDCSLLSVSTTRIVLHSEFHAFANLFNLIMNISNVFRHPATPYVAPFATFLVLTEIGRWIPGSLLWIYPVKTIFAGVLLAWFRRAYFEVKFVFSWLAIAVGLGVFILWIGMEGYYPLLAKSKSISPYDLVEGIWYGAKVWIGIRLFGAVVIVPIMEELFWRSFLLRYLINTNFKQVTLGAFSWSSLLWTVLLFGLEHHRWLAGMGAGFLYTLLLYRTKRLSACILAHAITNLALGIYVLLTQQWEYW